MLVHLVAGARPNYMKVGPIYRALAVESWCDVCLVDTAQHYDDEMAGAFRRELGLPEPDIRLSPGGETHAEVTARVMVEYERACLETPRPHWVVVVGDVNSTLAAALVAKKLDLRVGHVEAGLRSGDRSMPEEINRLAIDAIADVLWAPSADAVDNLRREGIDDDRVELVGNVMIDALVGVIDRARVAGPPVRGLPASYAVATVHRPSNVDDVDSLGVALEALATLARELPVVLVLHPRTRHRIETHGLGPLLARPGVMVLPPQPHSSFIGLILGAALVVTDSGGLQEETTYLGIPCLTMRTTTERPVTITDGTNRLSSWQSVLADAAAALASPLLDPPPLWDGHAAERIVASLRRRSGAARQ